jgi:hypothetical protein
MADNSFLIKAWSITLNVAIFGLKKDDIDYRVISIAIFLTLMFWILDAYFLKQERTFRKRYDEVRVLEENNIDFSMKLESEETSDINQVVVFFSFTLCIFYGMLFLAIFLFGNFL